MFFCFSVIKVCKIIFYLGVGATPAEKKEEIKNLAILICKKKWHRQLACANKLRLIFFFRYSPPPNHGPGLAGAGLQRHPLSPPYSNPEDRDDDGHESNQSKKQRKRREMQAITKIVETREFPYLDDYFWKNNGNTTHKSGRRSVYYKCSNSGKVRYHIPSLYCQQYGNELTSFYLVA